MDAPMRHYIYDRREAEDFESFRLHSRSGVPLEFISFPEAQKERFLLESQIVSRKDSSTILCRSYLYSLDRRRTDELPYVVMDLFRLGFLRRDAEALYLLGHFYMEGYGVRRSETAAYDMFTQSAGLGLALSSYQLGICCFHGIGTEQNLDAARKRFVESLVIRDPDSRAYIAVIDLILSRSQIESRKAFHQLESAAKDASQIAVRLTREALTFNHLQRNQSRVSSSMNTGPRYKEIDESTETEEEEYQEAE